MNAELVTRGHVFDTRNGGCQRCGDLPGDGDVCVVDVFEVTCERCAECGVSGVKARRSSWSAAAVRAEEHARRCGSLHHPKVSKVTFMNSRPVPDILTDTDPVLPTDIPELE